MLQLNDGSSLAAIMAFIPSVFPPPPPPKGGDAGEEKEEEEEGEEKEALREDGLRDQGCEILLGCF